MALPQRISLLILLSILFFSSCNLLGENGKQDDLEANRQRWQKFKIDNYEFEVRKACFCPDYLYPAIIVVRDDTVNTVLNPQTREPLRNPDTKKEVRFSGYKTIDELFNVVEDAIQKDAVHLQVKYDRTLGYPKQIAIDFQTQVADDEVSYNIIDLVGQ